MPQSDVWLLVGLLSVTIPLVALARRANVSYPVVLVLGGVALGFIPGLPDVRLDPDLVLLIFLPPLLYWEAITAPTDVMRSNASQIWPLAIGLVFATTGVVAVVAHAGIAGLTWPMAFVLGSIVAPTDELASAAVLERMRVPRHLIAIVEGESLLNDASSLILYAAAVTAATTGVFRLGPTLLRFVLSSAGAVLLGLLVARLAVEGWRRIRDAQLQGVISFELPYLTYFLAQRFALSGVLAVVFAGIYANRFTPRVVTPQARTLTVGFWETLVFIVNAILFLLVGLQLNSLAHTIVREYSWQTILWYAFLINVAVILTRFGWILGQEYVPFLGASSEHPEPDWKHALIASWSGLRGAVSLAAALAIPVSTAAGAHLAHRDLVIFLTFTVIVVTLVGGGLTLPLLVRRLAIADGSREVEEDLKRGIAGMSEAALARIEQLRAEERLDEEQADTLRLRYRHKLEHADGHPANEREALRAEAEIVDAQRDALVAMRERGEIDNTVLRRLQRVLDVASERIERLSSHPG
jgi:CPA1 family monovalent cation:H+ antiporter